ncbi:RNA-directed DNA polymerase (reverse transcriptase)-related family protein [Rhynchospora pubera]|uniref:RNA-directed DNA polymerase (Reverse transcriptase)-related family protein n=1 Tax=Rhynchospora pubera TaxID=906938 RepID=A0AAV8F0E5_9POAL|nr:RNA-directed DNA polymerase (reverse transcriptase)-related family protein [Rhynchospora pubera]
MRYLNVPQKIIDLLLFSFKNAKVTIQINGTGDGFINPTRGLRQGCPMSPYCFIMVMEMLTRRLQQAEAREQIRGIKLAPNCPILTHVVYADDLILLGHADGGDRLEMYNIMEDFGVVSGLVINPAKSKLWLSKRCDEQIAGLVQHTFQAEEAEEEEKYLGALLSRRNSAKRTGLMLLEKMKTKLTGWRSNMLTHAGRLVLLKSVLLSLPVYYMSMENIPKGLIKQMESLIAKFFWGKTDQTRYMAFVAWRKICQPVERGGLGVRQLDIFGDALFLKMVWAMISSEDKIWVKVCRGKYYHNLGFWRATNVAGASSLWRHVVKKRDFFKYNVNWQLFDGKKVEVLSQPWYEGWQVATQAIRRNRMIKIADVFDFDADQWRREEISNLLGESVADHIMQTVKKPCRIPGLSDSLIWDYNKAGKYTVKDGYQCAIMRMGRQENEVTWQYVWKWKGLVPKVKIFMWRVLTDGLPLAYNMHRRIHNISPMCARCNQENEFPTHCFFFCQGSRMVWFTGDLGIRTDNLPLDMREAVQHITQGMNDDYIRIFCYTLWEIWLARNEWFFQHKTFDPSNVCRKVRAWVGSASSLIHEGRILTQLSETVSYEIQINGWQMIIDASWDATKRMGAAFLVYQYGWLHTIGMVSKQADDPFESEALALQEVVELTSILVHEQGGQTVQIFSDCLNLVSAIKEHNTENLPSWRARPLVATIASRIHQLNCYLVVSHVQREAIKPAHDMANHARRMGVNYIGQPTAAIMCQHRIDMKLDAKFFQQVQEAPP